MAPIKERSAAGIGNLSEEAVIGIGAGVGGLLLFAATIVLFKIYTKRREYNSAISEIEGGREQTQVRQTQPGKVPKAEASHRISGLLSADSAQGWGALSSSETVHQLQPVARDGKRLKLEESVEDGRVPRSPKRVRLARAMSFKRKGSKRLSAIVESPKSTKWTPTTTHATLGRSPLAKVEAEGSSLDAISAVKPHVKQEGAELVVLAPQSSSRVSGASTHAEGPDLERPMPTRSKSIGCYLGSRSGEPRMRPALHNRSASFGARAAGPAPNGPLPPLPQKPSGCVFSVPDRKTVKLVGHSDSPSAQLAELLDPLRKDTTQQDAGVLTSTANWDTNNSIPAEEEDDVCVSRDSPALYGPRALRKGPSVCSSKARFSSASFASQRTSCSSISSLKESSKRLSVPQIKTADRMSISRVSSSGSLQSDTTVKILSTPKRRVSRVSMNGSPAERKQTSSILRSISSNVITPSRPASTSTEVSLESDVSNPFQWQSPLQSGKPSAMKGSPSARKGHRRQNCVRISTLAPIVLGPPSRPTTPSIMEEIAEEPSDANELDHSTADQMEQTLAVNRVPRTSLAPDIRLNAPTKLRASLTPSSPTLSLSAFHYDNKSSPSTSNNRLSTSPAYSQQEPQHSRDPSLFSIPSFPSLVYSTCVQDGPTLAFATPPTFAFTRPSIDADNENSPPFAWKLSPTPAMTNGLETGSELAAASQEYDPTSPHLYAEIVLSPNHEYDPASPSLEYPTPESDPPTPRLAAHDLIATFRYPVLESPRDSVTGSATSLAVAGEVTPSRAKEAATFSPSRPTHPLDRIPLLLPPNSDLALMHPRRPAPPPPAPSPAPTSQASPASATTPSRQFSGSRDYTPLAGPRTEPARDLRKSVMALRRMNSSISMQSSPDCAMGGRRYLKLGREASPLLPFTNVFEDVDLGDGDGDREDSPGIESPRRETGAGFDFGFVGKGVAAQDENDALGGLKEREAEAKRNAEEEQLDLDLVPEGLSVRRSTDAAATERRVSTVWEDGEMYWQRHGLSSSAVPAGRPKKWMETFSSGMGQAVTETDKGAAIHTPRAQSKRFVMGGVGTPKSLYDADGFLRT